MNEYRYLTKKQIYENFDVEYIRRLIAYTEAKHPIRVKNVETKALFEEFGGEQPTNVLVDDIKLDNKYKINEEATIEIPKALFEEMVKFMNNNKSK
jgi:hypothetical protein